MGEAKIRGRLGKPRRSDELSQVFSVRLPPQIRTYLNREFGSLGNALVYLYRGIQELKEREDLPTEPDVSPDAILTKYDLEDIFIAVRWYSRQENHHHLHKKRLERLAAKILDTALLGHKEEDPEEADLDI